MAPFLQLCNNKRVVFLSRLFHSSSRSNSADQPKKEHSMKYHEWSNLNTGHFPEREREREREKRPKMKREKTLQSSGLVV